MPSNRANNRTAAWAAVWAHSTVIVCLLSPSIGLGGSPKQVLGATADFLEKSSGLVYTARVDTGATTCSIHAEKVRIEDEVKAPPGSKKMLKNIGKKVSFNLLGSDGKPHRVHTTIADTVRVKTSEEKERRYKVWLTIRHGEVERRVHVTLNDRSHMEYPLLIGRNFLCGKFLVDVEKKHTPAQVADKAAPKTGDGVTGAAEKKDG